MRNYAEFIKSVCPPGVHSEDLKHDLTLGPAAVQHREIALQYAPDDMKSSKQVVLAAITKSFGAAFEFASEALRSDSNFVLEAIKINAFSLKHATSTLKKDHEFILKAIEENEYALQFADKELQNNIEIVTAAVKKDGYTLEFASDDLKNNKDVVLAAVNQTGHALQYASEHMKKDKKVVLAAAKQNLSALQYVSPEMRLNVSRCILSYSSTRLSLFGFFGGSAAMAVGLSTLPSAKTLVIHALSFLPQAPAIGLTIAVSGLAIALLSVMAHELRLRIAVSQQLAQINCSLNQDV